ncbi:MAG: radical SAM protein [Candidatus Woesearchaeota archaeon]
MIFKNIKNIFRNKKRLLSKNNSKNTGSDLNKLFKNALLKEFYENKLEFLGIKDGEHAFIGPNSAEIELTSSYANEEASDLNHNHQNKEKTNEEKTILDYDRIIDLLKELKSIGTREIIFVLDEDLLEYQRIFEILAFAKELGFVCEIKTRFDFANKELTKNIFDLGIDCVNIELLECKNEEYFRNRIERIKENLEFIRACSKDDKKKPSIRIKSIISKSNYKEFYRILEFSLENSNFSEFYLANEIFPKKDAEKRDLFLNEDQLREILGIAESVKDKYKNKPWQNSSNLNAFIHAAKNYLMGKISYKNERIDFVPCYVGWVFARIMADGSVVPCLKAHRMPIGNIYKKSFKEIFFSKEYDEFRYCAKHLDKGENYFKKIGCYECCRQNDKNFNIHAEFESLNHSKGEILDYAFKLRTVKGMIELLKSRNQNCKEPEIEHKKILAELMTSDFEEIKKRIDFLYEAIMDRLNEKPFSKNKNSTYEISDKEENRIDVFLIIPPPWDVDMPPMGIAYLSSNLKSCGIKTEVIDLNIMLYNRCKQKYRQIWNPEKIIYWKELNFHKKILEEEKCFVEEIINKIISKNPLVVGLSVNDSNINFACELTKIIKQRNRNLKIILGGPASNLDIPHYLELREYVDLVVIGEGEIVLAEIVNWLKKGRDLECFPKIFLKDGMQFFHSENLNDLNSIEFPTYEEFNLKDYEKPTLPILLSRGCINRCRFCSDWMRRKKYSCRSPENVVSEIEHHIRKHNIRSFLFHDLIINGDFENLKALCNLIANKKLKISWSAQAFVDNRMSLKFLKLLRRAGCINLVFGVESCSDDVLKKMNKNFKVEDLVKLIKRLKKARIKADFNIIIGYPGENEREFKKTYDFISKHRKYINRISSLSPCLLIEKTTLSKNIEEIGICNEIKDAWLKWYSKCDKNDYELRKSRVKEIVNLANRLKIPVALVNLYDENY